MQRLNYKTNSREVLVIYITILTLSLTISMWYGTLILGMTFDPVSILSVVGPYSIVGALALITLLFGQWMKNKIRQYLHRIRRLSIRQWGCWKYCKDDVMAIFLIGITLVFALQLMLAWISLTYRVETIDMIKPTFSTQILYLFAVIIRAIVLRGRFKGEENE